MSKKSLSKFFIVFVFTYFLFILLAILNVKTGFINYKNISTKYWTDEKEFYYAINSNNKNYLVSNDKVQAGAIQDAWGSISGAVENFGKNVKAYVGMVSDIQGTVNGMVVSTIDTGVQAITGCRVSDMSSQITTEKCDMSGSVLNKSLSNNSDSLYVSGGAMGFVNYFTKTIMLQSSKLADINYFVADNIKNTPIFGTNSKVLAAVNAPRMWEYPLDNVAMGESFYNLWVMIRNFTYFLIIIPTIALGFAIMFRFQIAQQTQITLLGIIPKLLVVLFLITFSYPISSIIVQSAKPITDFIVPIFSTISNSIEMNSAFNTNWNGLLLRVAMLLATVFTYGLFGILLLAILLIAGLIAGIKYLYVVTATVVKIGFLIAFSPLIFLVSAFPGKDDVIKQYFLNLIANVFGLVGLSVFYLSCLLIGLYANNQITSLLDFPIYFGLNMVAIGLLWKSPEAPKIIAGLIGAKSLFDMGSGDPRKR